MKGMRMTKGLFAATICFAVFFASCDQPTENVTRTTLTIRNESSHEITQVVWNNAFFTTGTNTIGPATSVTLDVEPGSGFLRLRPSANLLHLRTQQLITVTEGAQAEFILMNSTIAVREDGAGTGTFGTFAGEAATAWTATPVGSPATTAISFAFAADPGSLSAADFRIAPVSGAAEVGELTGTGTERLLGVSGVRAGVVLVSIERPGIAGESQEVTLLAPADITWTANAVGRPTTNAINFTFTADPGTMQASDFTITPGTGSATIASLTGNGLVRTLNVTGVSAGTVLVSVNRAGVVGVPQSVTLVVPDDITWTASAVGSPTTTAINFTFSADPGTMQASDFAIAPGTGSATITSLTGSGLVRTLNVTGVSAGTVLVSVNRAGVVGVPQSVELVAPGDITWTASAVGSPATTAINFTFSADPGTMQALDFAIATGTGSATIASLTGSGFVRTLNVANVSAGTVLVSVNRAGIVGAPQSVTLVVPADITWSATPVGSPTTTAINISFSANPGNLEMTNFTISPETGSATITGLSGTGTLRTLNVSNVSTGTVFIAINQPGVAAAPQSVWVSAPITWTATPIGSPTTTAINFVFSSDPGTISQWAIDIIPGTGSALSGSLSGSGTLRTLTVSNVTAGTVMIAISRAGISNEPQTITLSAAGVAAMTLNISGIPAAHNGRDAWVYLWAFPGGNFVAEAQGTITGGSLSVTFTGVPPGNYFVDVEIDTPAGWVLFREMGPRPLNAGNNNIPWSGFISFSGFSETQERALPGGTRERAQRRY